MEYLPHIEIFLRALRINRDRLASKSKIAVDAKVLRHLLQSLAEAAPFSSEFYMRNNPDIAEAHACGQIKDLRAHFIQQGYFEGRSGAGLTVNEDFYTSTYPDVADAVKRGDVTSAGEHYLRSGAAEGRIPNALMKEEIEGWLSVLRDEVAR